jgi:hypothetical protein
MQAFIDGPEASPYPPGMKAICLIARLILAVHLYGPLSVSAQTPSANSSPHDPLVDLIRTPRPPGPYSAWPEAERETALKAIQERCDFMVSLVLGNYHGPKEARTAGTTSMLSACVAHEMPEDWPGAAAARGESIRRRNEARVFDRAFPDPQILFGPNAPRYEQPPAPR